MTWHERQNWVDVARSICSENPVQAAITGSAKSATNARILPSRERVSWTRKPTNRAITAAANQNKRTTDTGIAGSYLLLRQAAIVVDQSLDLVRLELLAVGIHVLAFAVGDHF